MSVSGITTTTQYLTFKLGEEVFALDIAKVQEVLDLDADQIEPAPRIGTKLRTEFIRGMGKRNDSFIIIPDVDRIFSGEEIAIVRVAETYQPEEEAN